MFSWVDVCRIWIEERLSYSFTRPCVEIKAQKWHNPNKSKSSLCGRLEPRLNSLTPHRDRDRDRDGDTDRGLWWGLSGWITNNTEFTFSSLITAVTKADTRDASLRRFYHHTAERGEELRWLIPRLPSANTSSDGRARANPHTHTLCTQQT